VTLVGPEEPCSPGTSDGSTPPPALFPPAIVPAAQYPGIRHPSVCHHRIHARLTCGDRHRRREGPSRQEVALLDPPTQGFDRILFWSCLSPTKCRLPGGTRTGGQPAGKIGCQTGSAGSIPTTRHGLRYRRRGPRDSPAKKQSISPSNERFLLHVAGPGSSSSSDCTSSDNRARTGWRRSPA